MTDKEKAERYDSLMTAIDFERKSIAARMEEEKMDAEAPNCLTPLKGDLHTTFSYSYEFIITDDDYPERRTDEQ